MGCLTEQERPRNSPCTLDYFQTGLDRHDVLVDNQLWMPCPFGAVDDWPGAMFASR